MIMLCKNETFIEMKPYLKNEDGMRWQFIEQTTL